LCSACGFDLARNDKASDSLVDDLWHRALQHSHDRGSTGHRLNHRQPERFALSEGQWQRLGIARALLKDAPIIVLDEATSALDSEAELETPPAIGAVMQGRTVLAIAHRLSTVANFDRLVILREGRIVERGTLGELRGRRGLFDRMCRLREEAPMRVAS
jgi:ABC-type multidrug transport system fused ATPase/permease subunit